jgi:hypothetical protein
MHLKLSLKLLKVHLKKSGVRTPSVAPVPEIFTYYKMMPYSSIPVFIVLSVWIYHNLKEFEAGNVETVRFWAPILSLDEVGGFWVVIFVTPVLAIICCFACCKIIKNESFSTTVCRTKYRI